MSKNVLFVFVVLILLESDSLIEGLRTFVAFGEEVKAGITDMFLDTEVLEIVDLFAFNLELHHAPVFQANSIALTQIINLIIIEN